MDIDQFNQKSTYSNRELIENADMKQMQQIGFNMQNNGNSYNTGTDIQSSLNINFEQLQPEVNQL